MLGLLMGGSAAPRAVFIAGLGHSGSTLLDLMLAGHGKVIGVGEAETLLRLHQRDRDAFLATRCSCGTELSACPLWAKVAEGIDRADARTVADGYRCLLDTFTATFGPEATLVDSSKNLEALAHLCSTGADVSVLYLIRDVRGWMISMRDRNRDRGHHHLRDVLRHSGRRGLTRFAGQTSLAYFRFWRRRNQGMQRAIRDQGVPMLRLGYEPLATATVPTMEAVATWLGLSFEPGMLAPNPDGSHTGSGNDMRLSPEKLRAVAYDTRWLTRRDWILPAAVCPGVMRYNREQVYASPVAVT